MRTEISTLSSSLHQPAASWRLLACLGLIVFIHPAPVDAYQLIGPTWDTERGPSEFVIDPAGSDDISDGSDIAAVQASFERWSCIEGSRFRMRERTDIEGIAVSDLEDGINTVFWDEDGTSGVNLGPSTLGVNISNGGGTVSRDQSDVVFNGMDYTWSTTDNPGTDTVDIASIAIHEIGHWVGLGHSCTDTTEADCLPIEDSVMAPAYTTGTWREPKPDDIDGVLAMYAQDDEDDSTCTGPFRVGEFCTCDDDCSGSLLCIAQADGSNVCSKTCNGDAPDCGAGFNCILSEAQGDGPSPGKCVKGIRGEAAQVGTLCQPNGMCGARDCTQLGAAGGERVCFAGCQEDANCDDGYVCAGIACLLDPGSVGQACPVIDVDGGGGGGGEPMPGCAHLRVTASSRMLGVFGLLWLCWRSRRRVL